MWVDNVYQVLSKSVPEADNPEDRCPLECTNTGRPFKRDDIKYEIRILFNYVDDSFGPTLGSDLLWFGPYHNNIPFPQARFLSL